MAVSTHKSLSEQICEYAVDIPELKVLGYKNVTLKGCKLQPMGYAMAGEKGWKRKYSVVQCPEKGYRDNYQRCPYHKRAKELGI